MGYYADLIKEKQNAKPFYTLQGRELKTRSEVERYISDLEKEEREYFSYLRSYERKLEEAKNEPKPHSIGWADRISKYTDQIKSYKRSIERTDNWKSKAKEWLSQNRNSKEEKDNDKVVEKYSKYGATIEIIQTDSGKYRYRVSKNGKGHETFTVETSISAAEREAEYAAKNLQNEKEETENASEADIRAMYAQIQELKKKGIKGENIDKFYAAVNYREAAEQHRKKYKETGEIGYKWAAERADKQADQWVAEIKRSMRNEKEKGYYAKLIEEKKNLTYDVDKLAKQVKTWLDTGAYSEREIAEKLEKDYGMPKSTANHILEKGKQLRAQA